MKKKKKLFLSIEEAIDNLSTILEIDPSATSAMGLVEDRKIVIGEEDFTSDVILWLGPDSMDTILDVLKESYIAIYEYLEKLYWNKDTDWESEKNRKGIEAMMYLVGEASHKMQKYLEIVHITDPRRNILHSPEYQKLQDFYVDKIEKKIQKIAQNDEEDNLLPLNVENESFVDMEAIKQDQEYELFYMQNSEEKPFFTHQILRNIRLICDFNEESLEKEDDPLLQLQDLQDKDAQVRAQQILQKVKKDIENFYQIKVLIKANELAGRIHKTLLALMLASNPRNLLKQTYHKNCIEYFTDFQQLLRKCLLCDEYQKYVAYPEKADTEQAQLILHLLNRLCKAFFFCQGGIQEELIGFIYRLINKAKMQKKNAKDEDFWTEVLQDQEKIHKILSCYPNGPLGKDLDVLREQETQVVFFDPIAQKNLPTYQYEITFAKNCYGYIRLPCPTKQYIISQAKVIDEFSSWMRCNSKEKKKHLIIHLQDRTSWKSQARSYALENMALQAEYKEALWVITLAKDGSFYHQTAEYLDCDTALSFIQELKKQLTDKENPYYFYLYQMRSKDFLQFISKLVDFVYEAFFDKKKTLTRRQRQDFIEIVYHFLILKILHMVNCESFSFSCKDAVDTGAAMGASFYAFWRILQRKKWEKKEKDFFLYLLYSPALMVRERAIDTTRLMRVLSFLKHMDNVFAKHHISLRKQITKILGFSI